MDPHVQEHREYGFAAGLLAGTFVGAGLALWLVPGLASELGQRVSASARHLRDHAFDQHEHASARAGEAAHELKGKGESVRDDVADAAVRAAQVVERFAAASKGERS